MSVLNPELIRAGFLRVFASRILHEQNKFKLSETSFDRLRSGALDAEIAAADLASQATRLPGIQIQLLNPGSWLSAGRVSLELEISRRADKLPQSGARVDATIEGALRDGTHSAHSDDQGRAKIQFPLPPLGKGDLALVIQAKADTAQDEIRFSMRTRNKPAEVSKPQ